MADYYYQMNSYSQLTVAITAITVSIGSLASGMGSLWSAYTAHTQAGNRAEAESALQQYRQCEREKSELELREQEFRKQLAQCTKA